MINIESENNIYGNAKLDKFLLSTLISNHMDSLVKRLPELSFCRKECERAFTILRDCYASGGKVLICGNGGSASDAEHIVGELMKSFLKHRKIKHEDAEAIQRAFPEDADYLVEHLQGALPAISLSSQLSILTAFSNDVAADMAFAQQTYGYLQLNDVLIGLSTSGNSLNVINAVRVAKSLGIHTIALTGRSGGRLDSISDVTIKAPADATCQIQEYHLSIYHTLCAMLEEEFF